MKSLTALVILGLVGQSLSAFCPSSVVCPAEDPEDVVQFPNPDDCASFCKCYEGKAYLMKCPGNLLYNPKLEVCDYPQDVHCDTVESTEAEECSPEIEAKCPNPDKYYPVYFPIGNGHCYCACSGGKAWKQCCPAHLIFDVKKSACERPKVSSKVGAARQCDSSLSAECPAVDPTPPKYLPDPSDCHSFCECNGGIAWYQRCPDDLVFDPNRNVCVQPGDYPCHSGINVGLGRRCPDSVSSRCPATDPYRPVYFPYPGDCRQFCECSNAVAYAQYCSKGLVYHPDLEACGFDDGSECRAE